MKKVLLITTGGTIACRQTEHGLKPALTGQELLTEQIHKICQIKILDLMQIDSTDMRYPQMYHIGEDIWKNRMDFDGFVITHGTDTMAYTAAFLSHILKNFGKPVILTGSMLPFGIPGSDAEGNLKGALTFAVSDYKGVGLYDMGNLIYGRCAMKVNSVKVGAFQSMHMLPDGRLDSDGRITIFQKREPFGDKMLLPKPQRHVILIKLTPDTQPEQLSGIKEDTSVILEAFGAGGIPEVLAEALENLHRQGIKVYMKSQCLIGNTELSKYEVGHRALKFGVVSLGAVTAEDALAMVLCEDFKS